VTDVLYLAWRYLGYHKGKTAVLVAAVAVIVYLPVGLNIIVGQSAAELTARADATPLLIGAKGSPLELVLNSLYFQSDTPPPLKYGELARVRDWRLGDVIPLYTRFSVQDHPVVGTSLSYFDYRGLEVRQGRRMAVLGECVLGDKASRQLGVEADGHVLTSPESVFDLAGAYPLKMKVVGVLQPTGGPDDWAVFADVKTCWVVEGLAHGHQDLSQPEAASGVLRKEGSAIVANASVVQFNEITPENVDSFHFHGDPATFPITSLIVAPPDQKSSALLQGRYLDDANPAQIVQPAAVMRELLGTVFTVRRYILAGVIIVGLATLATMALVFALSLQLRRREMETMRKIGGSPIRINALAATEIVSVFLVGIVLALLLSGATSHFAAAATRLLISLS
jgi:putative ABC transport system permease protein